MTGRSAYLLERAWVGGAVHDDVVVEIEDGRFTSVTLHGQNRHFQGEVSAEKRRIPRRAGETDTAPTRLPGLTLPGLANTHSHAFHRALRGRTQQGRGTFWTWRTQMYAVAERLDPDSMFLLARAVYREMVAAGMTTVGEFHYLHHQPDGTPYADPNEMSHALVAAAHEAGIRLTLLDTCYLSGGFGEPLQGVQRRFGDGDVGRWRDRVDQIQPQEARLGAAIHSVRAVAPDAMPVIAEWATGRPLHVHVSEQVAENQACVAAYARTPVELLADHDVLGPLTTAVHATHLGDDDVDQLVATGTYAGFCPTTERDLGDGIGPGRRLHDAGVRLTLGSDSHAVVDPFEEMRALELDERLATRERGHWTAAELLRIATVDGHASLGWDDVGEIAVGQRADLVTIDTTTPRTAGTEADEHTAVFAATAADVTHVVVDGHVVVHEGDREEVGRDLQQAIGALWA